MMTYTYGRDGAVSEYEHLPRGGRSFRGSYVLAGIETFGYARCPYATLARYETETCPAVRKVVEVSRGQKGAARRCLEAAKTRPDWDRARDVAEGVTP